MNTPENKYTKPVTRINYNELKDMCNPTNKIERGDECDIGC